ncbi:MAG TPA: hypothetical protein VGS79_14740 [Puia sp.]|nr:hypothetical protein [Puia sp.]
MPLRKDYLLDQLRDFFAALTRIAARIQAGELERAEEEIDALTSGAAIGELLRASSDGSPVADHTYAAWKFQAQLLVLKIRVLEARGFPTAALREQAAGVRAQAVGALRKLIALRPEVYDIELEEQLRGLEKS